MSDQQQSGFEAIENLDDEIVRTIETKVTVTIFKKGGVQINTSCVASTFKDGAFAACAPMILPHERAHVLHGSKDAVDEYNRLHRDE